MIYSPRCAYIREDSMVRVARIDVDGKDELKKDNRYDIYAVLQRFGNGQTLMLVWYEDLPVSKVRLMEADTRRNISFTPEKAKSVHVWGAKHIETIYNGEVRHLIEEKKTELSLPVRFWRAHTVRTIKPEKDFDFKDKNYASIHYFCDHRTSMFIWFGTDAAPIEIELRDRDDEGNLFTYKKAASVHRWGKPHIETIFNKAITGRLHTK